VPAPYAAGAPDRWSGEWRPVAWCDRAIRHAPVPVTGFSAMSAPATASAQLASVSTQTGIVSEPFYSICFLRFRQEDSARRVTFLQKLVKSANGLRFSTDRRSGFFNRDPAENVEMRPCLSFFDKFAEEEGCRYRSG